MTKRWVEGWFALALAAWLLPAQVHGAVFDVKSYGAKGDAKALDSPAINQAIEAAAAAGGGTVHFPAGTYVIGSIRLRSNLTLQFEPGTTLEASADPAAYDAAEPNQWDKFQDFGHSHFHNSLIWGEGLENVSIEGPGLIGGKALARERGAAGDKAIALKLCRKVTLRDFSILSGGHFGILATGVDNLTIDNVTIDTNRDGIDVDSCRNVRISNSSVNTPNDDAIVLKGTHALGFARPTENVTIVNCLVSGYDIGSLLDGTYKRTVKQAPDRDGPTGRVKIGTESEGDFRNITIANVVFDRSRGLALESVDGAHIEDIAISNITMREVSNAPIFLRLGSRMRAPEGTAGGIAAASEHQQRGGVRRRSAVRFDHQRHSRPRRGRREAERYPHPLSRRPDAGSGGEAAGGPGEHVFLPRLRRRAAARTVRHAGAGERISRALDVRHAARLWLFYPPRYGNRTQ